MRNDRFEWDDEKARQNWTKHGVSFQAASRAYDDPGFIDIDDPDPNETRYNRLCAYDGIVLVVTYVTRGDRARIISARRGTRYEQQRYYRQAG